jgi:hypothetical protein
MGIRYDTAEVRQLNARSRVTNGRASLPRIDGRTRIAKRFHDISAELVADNGGLSKISEAKLQLIRRFAFSAVMAEMLESNIANEHPIDVSEHIGLTANMLRIAGRIGIRRRPKVIEHNDGGQ